MSGHPVSAKLGAQRTTELKDGQIIKLDSPRYVYEAELEKGNQVAGIEVSSDGQVIEAPQWTKKGAKEN